jgi:hypothetical protein
MLAVMDFHRAEIDIRLKGIVGIGQIRKRVHLVLLISRLSRS